MDKLAFDVTAHDQVGKGSVSRATNRIATVRLFLQRFAPTAILPADWQA